MKQSNGPLNKNADAPLKFFRPHFFRAQLLLITVQFKFVFNELNSKHKEKRCPFPLHKLTLFNLHVSKYFHKRRHT